MTLKFTEQSVLSTTVVLLVKVCIMIKPYIMRLVSLWLLDIFNCILTESVATNLTAIPNARLRIHISINLY